MPVRSSRSRRLHTFAVVIVLAAAAGILAFVILRPVVSSPRSPGLVQATEIRIGPEIGGRLARFAASRGQQ